MAEVSTNLLVLNRKDLKQIQEKFDSINEELTQVAQKRYEHH